MTKNPQIYFLNLGGWTNGLSLEKNIPFESDRPIEEIIEWAGKALMNTREGLFFLEVEKIPSRFYNRLEFCSLLDAIKQARDIMVSLMTEEITKKLT